MKRSIAVICAVLAVGALCWSGGRSLSGGQVAGNAGQRQGIASGVEKFLPSSAVLALCYDGSLAHLPALKETASWKAFEDTGLNGRLVELLTTLMRSQGPDLADLLGDSIEQFRSHGAAFAISLGPDGTSIQPFAVFVFPQAEGIGERLSGFAGGLLEQDGLTIQHKSIGNRSITAMTPTANAPPGLDVGWWAEDGHFVVCAGINAIQQVTSTADGKSPNIATNGQWKSLRGSKSFTVDTLGWLDVGRIIQQFGDMPMPPPGPGGRQISVRELLEILGLDNVQRVTAQSGYRGPATWNDVRIEADGPLKGLAALLQQRTLALSDLPPMPKNTSGFFAMTLDAGKAWETSIDLFRKLTQVVDPNAEAQVNAGLAQVKSALGFDPKADLLDGLSDVWCIYADSASMPIPIGFAPVVVVGVKDRERVASTLAKIGDRITQEVGRSPDFAQNFSIRRTEREGIDYFSINLSGMPFVPTIMVSDQWMLASLTPASAQSFVQRTSGRLSKWEPAGEVAAAMKELPTGFTSIAVTDPVPGWQQMMLLAPMGMNLLQQNVLPNIPSRTGEPIVMPFAVEDLPAVELITEPMFPGVSVTFNTPNGIGSTSRQAVPSLPGGNLSSGAAVPVLIALLLPAIQQAREAARRTQSANNLKQIGLAIHNYHDVYNHLPVGTVPNDGLTPEERLSWMTSVLPFVEQTALYESMDFESGWNSEANSAALQTRVDVFVNPSQPGPRDYPSSSDYVGIAGVGADAASLMKNDPRAGMFGYDRKVSFRDVTDGMSNTFMVSDSSVPGTSFLSGGGVNIRSFSQRPYLNGPDGIGGPHRGIVNFLMGDGSVRAVSTKTDESVLEALATIAGGELVGDF